MQRPDVSSVPLCMLMWRALCHWLGGMGILVLLISIFPLWGINNQSLAMAETPGSESSKMEAKSSDMGKVPLLELSAAFDPLNSYCLMQGPWTGTTLSDHLQQHKYPRTHNNS